MFFPQTGTIFEGRKLPLSAWADFLLQVFSYDSFASITRGDRRSDTILPYWMAKLFAALDGVQDSVVLSGRVWVDETYWPVAAKDAVRRPDGKLPRGLSFNQMCIGVGVDDSGSSVCFHEEFGKTSKAKTRAAFASRIERGSQLVHDMEGAHDAIVSDWNGEVINMAMAAKEIEKKYGISASTLDEIDELAANGELPGEPGAVSAGRPLKFGTALKTIGYKEVPETVEEIDRRAGSLGMTRSDYLRNLVRQDLAHA